MGFWEGRGIAVLHQRKLEKQLNLQSRGHQASFQYFWARAFKAGNARLKFTIKRP